MTKLYNPTKITNQSISDKPIHSQTQARPESQTIENVATKPIDPIRFSLKANINPINCRYTTKMLLIFYILEHLFNQNCLTSLLISLNINLPDQMVSQYLQYVDSSDGQTYIICLQYMRSKSTRAVQNSAPIIVYDVDEDLSSRCCICFVGQPSKLISPCQCSMRYHQTCLLRYIRQKLLTMKKQLDFSQLRCKRCKQLIKFLHYQNTHYSCTYFWQKLRTNWWNKSIICLIVNIIAIIVLGVILANHRPGEGSLYYGLLIGISALCFIFIISVVVFVQSNLMYKQIILVKVFEYIQIRNNTSSSDDQPHHNIASETFEIIINQTY